ncbi:ammonium transporter AmtB-like domain-containing protein [Phaeosphaeriaceae sp. PMI808]|nr:ammonium transporter AmtB-like domain-containing protein [Phaeosphaeriaceae sp. PMI808]
MLTASALVFLMVPGIALVYSGAADRHSAITMARIPLITTAFVGIQWYLWGYTLTFSPSTSSNANGTFSWLGGDTKTNAFRDVMVRPVGIQGSGTGLTTGPKIPELVFALYQGMFASFTASIVAGGVMRKAPIGRFLIFISIWSVVVYSPIARWTWHPQGWSRLRGSMDFAGGTAVHICSGATVAAYCVFFQLEVRGWKVRNLWDPWWRSSRETEIHNGALPDQTRPDEARLDERNRKLELEMQHLDDSENHSVTNIVLGTTLLWFGWFGFNGGSALGANLRAGSAVLATHVAACAGGSVGLLLEWFFVLPSKLLRKDTSKVPPSVLGFCDGAISGLVAITPAAGFVPVKVASVFGVVAAIVCKCLRYYVRKRLLPYDVLDICAIHAGGGLIGMLLTAAFADDVVTGLDGYSQLTSRTGGQRIQDQLVDVLAGFSYSFSATFAILVLLKLISKLLRPRLRATKQRIHKHLLLRNPDYRRRYESDGARPQDSHDGHRANVVKDKLVAVGQHSFLRE